MEKLTVAIVDDHFFMRKGLKEVLRREKDIEVIMEAPNGLEFINKLKEAPTLPNVCILDIMMPVMNGHQACIYLSAHYPDIKVIALSIHNDEHNIIRMISNGAGGYLSKNADPSEIVAAIREVCHSGFYHSDVVTEKLHSAIINGEIDTPKFTEKEITFLKLCCKDLTYTEIADEMYVSVKTVENYRESLFRKLKTKSKVGLVVYAYKTGIVQLFE